MFHPDWLFLSKVQKGQKEGNPQEHSILMSKSVTFWQRKLSSATSSAKIQSSAWPAEPKKASIGYIKDFKLNVKE